MLNRKQQDLYHAFYESTHNPEHLDRRIELLVGLAAAMALDCQPCTRYYLKLCRQNGINRGELGDVLAKVMAVAAGQKRLQATEVLQETGLTFDPPT